MALLRWRRVIRTAGAGLRRGVSGGLVRIEMKPRPLDERSHAFVVRVWEERRDIDGAPPTWRGSVDDVRAGTRVYFDTLDELAAILGTRSGMGPASRTALGCRVRRGRLLAVDLDRTAADE